MDLSLAQACCFCAGHENRATSCWTEAAELLDVEFVSLSLQHHDLVVLVTILNFGNPILWALTATVLLDLC